MTSTDHDLARRWLDAAREPHIRRDLDAVYAHVAREIESRGPVCWASGRCCNFARAGHRLYVTGLEAAVAALETPEPGGPALTRGSLDAAIARGDCPFLVANLCAARTPRPLGCRVYFCDRAAQDWQRSLSEAALADIRAIHDAHAIPYRYAEWRAMLGAILDCLDPPPRSVFAGR